MPEVSPELRTIAEGALANLRALGSLGGVEVDQTVWQAATFSDGKLTWWACFRTEDEVREALLS